MNRLKKYQIAFVLSTLISFPALSKVLATANCKLITMSNLSEPEVFTLELTAGAGINEKIIELTSTEKLKVELRDKSQSNIRYTESLVTISFIRNDIAGFSSSGETYANLNGLFKRGQDGFNLTCEKDR